MMLLCLVGTVGAKENTTQITLVCVQPRKIELLIHLDLKLFFVLFRKFVMSTQLHDID